MLKYCQKRNGATVPFVPEKITHAIYKAIQATGGSDYAVAEKLTDSVTDMLEKELREDTAEIEVIQNAVEKALIEDGHARTAKAYILYREKRRNMRECGALTDAVLGMFSGYLEETDWQVQENANTQKSINGLNNYVREAFTQ